jgi:hypothetical protein
MTNPEIMPETDACVRLLDGAEDELQDIRAAFASVSLKAASEKAAAEATRPVHPLRTRPAGEPPPLPADTATGNTARRTLAERLRRATSA